MVKCHATDMELLTLPNSLTRVYTTFKLLLPHIRTNQNDHSEDNNVNDFQSYVAYSFLVKNINESTIGTQNAVTN